MHGEPAAKVGLGDKLHALSTLSELQGSVAGSLWLSQRILEGGSNRRTMR